MTKVNPNSRNKTIRCFPWDIIKSDIFFQWSLTYFNVAAKVSRER